MSKAFAIGAKEAGAVSCLMTRVSQPVIDKLRAAVRQRGMRPFLQHDCVAKELFNTGFSSGTLPEFEAWRVQLTNKDDDRLATCFQQSLV